MIRKLLLWRDFSVVAIFVAMISFFALLTPHHVFLTKANFNSIGQLMPELGIVSLGVGMLMICGEFDLSIGSQIPLSAYIFAVLLRSGFSFWLIFPITLVIGVILGFINGFITTKTGIPSFIVTLGTMMFWRGVLYVQSKLAPLSLYGFLPRQSIWKTITIGKAADVLPAQMIWFVVIAIILGLLLYLHKFGNWIYSTGGNEEAAKAMGINTDRVKIICFIIVGILCAIVATLQVIRLGSFAATQGREFELRAIAASVVGGTSLWGGTGSMLGIFLGALTIQILENGLLLMRVPVFGISTFIGASVIVFVLLNSYLEKRRKRIRMR